MVRLFAAAALACAANEGAWTLPGLSAGLTDPRASELLVGYCPAGACDSAASAVASFSFARSAASPPCGL